MLQKVVAGPSIWDKDSWVDGPETPFFICFHSNAVCHSHCSTTFHFKGDILCYLLLYQLCTIMNTWYFSSVSSLIHNLCRVYCSVCHSLSEIRWQLCCCECEEEGCVGVGRCWQLAGSSIQLLNVRSFLIFSCCPTYLYV